MNGFAGPSRISVGRGYLLRVQGVRRNRPDEALRSALSQSAAERRGTPQERGKTAAGAGSVRRSAGGGRLATGNLVADERCRVLFGLPASTDFSFALFLARISAPDRSQAERHVAKAQSRAGDYQHDYRTVWPDGSVHWVFIKGRSYHDAGEPRCFQGIGIDATARKLAEEEALSIARDENLQRHRAIERRAAEHRGRNGGGPGARIEPAAPRREHLRPRKPAAADQEPAKGRAGRRGLEQIGKEANRAAEIIRRVRTFVQKLQAALLHFFDE